MTIKEFMTELQKLGMLDEKGSILPEYRYLIDKWLGKDDSAIVKKIIFVE
jgi:hypothetical protein